MLGLVSLAHLGPPAEVSHQPFRPVPSAKRLHPHLGSGRVQKRWERHCNSRWRQRAVCRHAAPGTVIQSPERHACARPKKAPPPPLRVTIPIKQPYPWLTGTSLCYRAQALICLFSDPRIKLSFTSEGRSGGPLLGTNSGGSLRVPYPTYPL